MGLVLPSGIAPTVGRCRAPSMNFFGDLQQGLAKVMAGSYDEAEVKARVQRQIKMKPCIMFAKSTCPFCTTARETIEATGAMFSCIEMDLEDDGMATKAELIGITGVGTVPQVFIGGEFIGGCNDGGLGGVVPLSKSGDLEQRLIKAGALVPGARI